MLFVLALRRYAESLTGVLLVQPNDPRSGVDMPVIPLDE